jgi:hypothetical protein
MCPQNLNAVRAIHAGWAIGEMRDGRAAPLDVSWDRAHALQSLGLAAR